MKGILKKLASIILSGCIVYGGVGLIPVRASSEEKPSFIVEGSWGSYYEEKDKELCGFLESRYPLPRLTGSQTRELKRTDFTKLSIFKKLESLPCIKALLDGGMPLEAFVPIAEEGAQWVGDFWSSLGSDIPGDVMIYHYFRCFMNITILQSAGYERSADYLFKMMYAKYKTGFCKNYEPCFRIVYECTNKDFDEMVNRVISEFDIPEGVTLAEYMRTLFFNFFQENRDFITNSKLVSLHEDIDSIFLDDWHHLLKISRLPVFKKFKFRTCDNLNRIYSIERTLKNVQALTVEARKELEVLEALQKKYQGEQALETPGDAEAVPEKEVDDDSETVSIPMEPSKRAKKNKRAREHQKKLREENRQALERAKKLSDESAKATDSEPIFTEEELEKRAILDEIIECNEKIAKKVQESEAITFKRKKDAEQTAKKEAKHQKQLKKEDK